jgi:hypothetical protein
MAIAGSPLVATLSSTAVHRSDAPNTGEGTLSRLVVSLVQRVTSRAGHDGLESMFDWNLGVVADEADRFKVAGDSLTEIDEREVASLIDNGIERERAPKHPDGLKLLFMDGVALKIAIDSVGYEVRTKKRGDRLGVGQSWSDYFPSPGGEPFLP